MELMPDHVHLFVEMDPRQPLHIMIRNFKGRSLTKSPGICQGIRYSK